MVSFRVRAQSLGEVAAQLQGVIGVFDANVEQAASVVDSVVNSSWVGEDADKFAEYWEHWNAAAIIVRTSLTTLAVQLSTAEGSYTATESGLSGGFAGRRQSEGAAVAGSASVASRVSGGRERALEDRVEQREAELISTGGTGQFVAGGTIAGRAQNQGGGPAEAEASDDSEGEADV